MPVEQPGRVSQWLQAARHWLPTARHRGLEWYDAVREDPGLIWRTPAVRYAVYGIGLLVVVMVVQWSIGALAPAGTEVKAPSKTASFHVLCSNPTCPAHGKRGYHFIINRKFGFDSFPVECPKCHQQTGQRALMCFSKTCKGQWTYAAELNKQTVCAYCREPIATK